MVSDNCNGVSEDEGLVDDGAGRGSVDCDFREETLGVDVDETSDLRFVGRLMSLSRNALPLPLFMVQTSTMLLLEAFHVLILRHLGGL